MDPLNKNISGNSLDMLLAKYTSGNSDAGELVQVENWMAGKTENRKYANDLHQIWMKCNGLQFTGTINAQAALEQLKLERDKRASHLVDKKLFPLHYRWFYAASVVVLAAVAIFLGKNRQQHEKHKQNIAAVIHYASGSLARTDTLPDGSVISLLPNSTLTYPADLQTAERNLVMTGEAFFTIAHDSLRPFRIAVNNLSVEDLGTSFHIKSSPGRTDIVVTNGRVRVTRGYQGMTLEARDSLAVPSTDSPWIKLPAGSTIPVFRQLHASRRNEKPAHALMVGDEPPILPLDKWIKGGPLNVYEKGKVYLVDFWAIWCGPCISGMDRLSAWQRKYSSEGLEVMGVTSEDAWGNSFDKVKEFINAKSDRFDYNFAWLPLSYRADHKYSSIIYNRWLELAYDSSTWALPQVFLIDRKGRIAYIGDGYSLDENFIVKVLRDSFDIAVERKNYIEKVALENKVETFLKLMDNEDLQAAKVTGYEIVENPLVTSHALMVIADNIFNKYQEVMTKELLYLGFEAAKKGVKLTDSKSPGHLAVLAKAYSLMNDWDQAVQTINAAILLSEGDYRTALQKDLYRYQHPIPRKVVR